MYTHICFLNKKHIYEGFSPSECQQKNSSNKDWIDRARKGPIARWRIFAQNRAADNLAPWRIITHGAENGQWRHEPRFYDGAGRHHATIAVRTRVEAIRRGG